MPAPDADIVKGESLRCEGCELRERTHGFDPGAVQSRPIDEVSLTRETRFRVQSPALDFRA